MNLFKKVKELTKADLENLSQQKVKSKEGSGYQILNGEAIHLMRSMPDNSIDLIAVDLPYGVTNNKWDSILPLDDMWKEFHRIGKENAAIVLTATQPFSSLLVASNLKYFKYEIIWEKTVSSGQLNVKHQPMRSHESILVFYKKKPTYNEQKTEGKPYSIKRDANYKDGSYGSQKPNEKQNNGFRHARSVIKIPNPRVKGGHPTQKPVELMDYIIKSYSNEGDVILDCCMGSGTTGVSAISLNRRFIGIELSSEYFDLSAYRLMQVENAIMGDDEK